MRFFTRDEDSLNNTAAFYLLLTFTILFFLGITSMGALAILRKIRRSRQSNDIESASKAHRRSRHPPSISIVNEKSAFLDSPASSPTESVPEIHLHFPEEQTPDGKRQSRVVIVKIGEKGSVGYEPYQEPLPVYQEKESPLFQDLDLERIGGLKEKETKA